jgi:hypothetical protein
MASVAAAPSRPACMDRLSIEHPHFVRTAQAHGAVPA